jgi:hypothetical protein
MCVCSEVGDVASGGRRVDEKLKVRLGIQTPLRYPCIKLIVSYCAV